MHIGFLKAYFSRSNIGGGEIHTENLARALEANGHRVTIFTNSPNHRRSGIDDLNVREYDTPIELNPINEIGLANAAWNDMVECDVMTLTDDSAWRGVDLPIPTAMVFHLVWHGWIERYRPITKILFQKPQAFLYRWMEKKICRKSDAIIAISPNIQQDIELIGNFNDKLYRIDNGVDIDRFHPFEKYEDFTVHFQGRLINMKNPDLLIEAANLSKEPWQVTIGGEGPLMDDLRDRVRDYGLQDRVEFLGFVPENELPARYGRSHVYTLPSSYEGMPLTVLEAAASGTALLVSERAATDFVTSEIGAVIEPRADVIAEKLDELYKSTEAVIEMGRNAREKAEDHSWESVASRYETVYNGIR